MLYSDFIIKAIDKTIVEADNGLFYLEPLWRNILNDNMINITDISDVKAEWCDIEDVLKLEVEKRNTEHSLEPYVLNWIHDIITASVEPAILKEETDYMKNLIDYMKANKGLNDEDWDNFKNS